MTHHATLLTDGSFPKATDVGGGQARAPRRAGGSEQETGSGMPTRRGLDRFWSDVPSMLGFAGPRAFPSILDIPLAADWTHPGHEPDVRCNRLFTSTDALVVESRGLPVAGVNAAKVSRNSVRRRERPGTELVGWCFVGKARPVLKDGSSGSDYAEHPSTVPGVS